MSYIAIDFGTTNSSICLWDGYNTTPLHSISSGKTWIRSQLNFCKNDSVILIGGIHESDAKDYTSFANLKSYLGQVVKFEFVYNNSKVIRSGIDLISTYLKLLLLEFNAANMQKCIITFPVYFNDLQKSHLRSCFEKCNLEIIKEISEPIAASLAFPCDPGHVLVVDIGGGTTDLAIVQRGDQSSYQTLYTLGDNKLGGNMLTELLFEEIGKSYNCNRSVCEKTKVQLSYTDNVTIDSIPSQKKTQIVSRHKFIWSCRPFFNQLEQLIEQILTTYAKGQRPSQLSSVIFSGGTSSIPYVQEIVLKLLMRYGHISVKSYTTSNTLTSKSIVSYGAAIFGIPTTDIKSCNVIQTTPYSFGVEMEGGVVVPIISADSELPTEKSMTFHNSTDNQTSLTISIFQGNRRFAKDNKEIGSCTINDIPVAKRGTLKITVTFKLDELGKLRVLSTINNKTYPIHFQVNVDKDESYIDIDPTAHELLNYYDTIEAEKIVYKCQLLHNMKVWLHEYYHTSCSTSDLTHWFVNRFFCRLVDILLYYDEFNVETWENIIISTQCIWNRLVTYLKHHTVTNFSIL